MTPRLRAELRKVPSYVAGRRPPSDAADTARLASNENPFDPLPSVVASVATAMASLNRYPDPASSALTCALAELHGVGTDQIAVSTGSVAILGQLAQICAEPGHEVLTGWRSFEAYPIVARLAGADPVEVALRDLTFDLDAIAASVSERTRLIFICNPNNPTGTVLSRAAIETFCDQVPRDVLIVIDEAYIDFAPSSADAAVLVDQRDNVCVLRTFSKAHGLAALRVGYAIASAPIIDALRKAGTPFGVSSLAQAAAVASLAALDEVHARVDVIIQERDRLASLLAAQGWRIPPSATNFLWLPTGEGTADFGAACEAAGILVRLFPEGTRVSIADRASNDRLADVAGHWLTSTNEREARP